MKNEVGFLIKQISTALEKRANNSLNKDNLTLSQVSVLFLLKNAVDDKMTFKDLEKALHVAQSTTVGIISRLEAKNMVESYIDPDDKRIKWVSITAMGKEVCELTYSHVKETETEIARGLTKEERATLITLLQKVADNLE